MGSAVRATPAATGLTMRWTMTAISPPADLYSAARAPRALSSTWSIAAGTSRGATFSTVSNIPAYECWAPSSEMPLDRTANGPLPRSPATASNRDRRSSAVNPAAMLVRTMPSGTHSPAASSSPRLAAFPPTSGTSAMRTSRRRRITEAVIGSSPSRWPRQLRRARPSRCHRRHPRPTPPDGRATYATPTRR